jgi:hypothetical protein
MTSLVEKIRIPASSADAAALFRACLSAASFWAPERVGPQIAWLEHAPFAFWLMESLRPKVVVELGTHGGFSYFTLCQSVQSLSLDSRCYAVDTWQGDEHAGFYDENVFQELEEHNRRHYSAFSSLIRSTFDEALPYFADRSIDLLHIDGRHFYEDVQHDFTTWRGKLSERAVVLFHDTNVRERNFGVHQFWEELSSSLPHFKFFHGNGLGIAGLGEHIPDRVRTLFSATESTEAATHIRNCYARLGSAVRLQFNVDELRAVVDHQQKGLAGSAATAAALRQEIASHTAEQDRLHEKIGQQSTEIARLHTIIGDHDTLVAQLQQQLQGIRGELDQAIAYHAEQARGLQQTVAAGESRLLALDRELTDRDATVSTLRQTINESQAELNALREMRATLQEALREREAAFDALRVALREQKAIEFHQELAQRAVEVESLRQQIEERDARLHALNGTLTQRDSELAIVRSSRSWRLTAPLRRFRRRLRARRLFALGSELRHRGDVRAIARSGLFDRAWYLRTYPDIAAWEADPILHYVMHGANEGRNPGPQFDGERYRREHADVRGSGINPLLHYIRRGRAEGREVYSLAPRAGIPTGVPETALPPELAQQIDVVRKELQFQTGRIDYALAQNEGIMQIAAELQDCRATRSHWEPFRRTNPLVSVCVATSDRAELLVDRCIRSLRNQTYSNVQIIVVGDHCIDDTGHRLAQLRDDRIVFENLPRRGPYPRPGAARWQVAGSNAMNRALELAEGDFIAHLDDDDEATSDRIENLLHFAQSENFELIWHPFWYENLDGTWRRIGNGELKLGQVTTGSVFYHHFLTRIKWDVYAFRLDEPGDWNRFRKIKALRPRMAFLEDCLTFHYKEQNQGPFVHQLGEEFIDWESLDDNCSHDHLSTPPIRAIEAGSRIRSESELRGSRAHHLR